MNEILQKIKERKSVRKFKPEMVPEELIEQVAAAGLQAASGRNLQAPIIVPVTNREVRDRLSAINAVIGEREGDPFYGAPVVLAVLSDKAVPTHVYDGSLTIGNMLLAADALGLGACWIHRAKQTFEMPEWKEWLRSLGVEGDYEGIGFCILGYPEEPYPKGHSIKENRVYWCR